MTKDAFERIELVRGDITLQDTKAIVNAANASLVGGGGVDGAIHRAGGPQILDECRAIGGCPTGQARLTSAGRLLATYVIHTVGPIYRGGHGDEAKLLAQAYRSSLELASRHGIPSLAFPAISTGAYGYPLPDATVIALKTTIGYLKEHGDIHLVRFVLFSDRAYEMYQRVLGQLMVADQSL